jgi:hypothetical protein
MNMEHLKANLDDAFLASLDNLIFSETVNQFANNT